MPALIREQGGQGVGPGAFQLGWMNFDTTGVDDIVQSSPPFEPGCESVGVWGHCIACDQLVYPAVRGVDLEGAIGRDVQGDTPQRPVGCIAQRARGNMGEGFGHAKAVVNVAAAVLGTAD